LKPRSTAIQLVQEKVQGVKIGREFAEQVLQPKLSDRVKKTMQMILPGVTDLATEKLISRTSDIRAMAALAIGSPAYQQQ
jgi:hypothetical protein